MAYAVTAIPGLILLASFVLGTLWTLQSSQPGLSMYNALPQAFGTSYYVISLSVNIVITILIIIRLFLYRRRMLAAFPDAVEQVSHYVSLATIMIESAALYAVLSLIFIVTYAIGNPLNQTFLTATSCGQQIAGFLIVHRVAQGRAWAQDTVTSGPLAFASSRARQLNDNEIDMLEQGTSSHSNA